MTRSMPILFLLLGCPVAPADDDDSTTTDVPTCDDAAPVVAITSPELGEHLAYQTHTDGWVLFLTATVAGDHDSHVYAVLDSDDTWPCIIGAGEPVEMRIDVHVPHDPVLPIRVEAGNGCALGMDAIKVWLDQPCDEDASHAAQDAPGAPRGTGEGVEGEG